MCTAVPMQVCSVEGFEARCGARGVERRVNLLMLMDALPAVGEWVLVHQGYATRSIDAAEARLTWELFDRLLGGSELQPMLEG